ncbi:DUF4097 family beta strand repeat-containing protein [Fodinibius halophilus]|uniref:DUF4097 domain-containing protein n=1 Tax=Fodinibius halophilus TaxID=1736908 RepID=A0A6M1TCU6_9BACT|nr:DUF4097 domain-containing protein [Fodinibius halophilus]
MELDFDHQSGRLSISSEYNEDKVRSGRREDCPDSYSQYSGSSNDDSYVVCSNIRYELRVPRDIALDVESISSDIKLVGLTGPIRAKSTSGYVDLSWPAKKEADISIKTVSGEAFTDLNNLRFENKRKKIPLVGYKLRGQIGGGGAEVSLESVSGNIFLRKEKT